MPFDQYCGDWRQDLMDRVQYDRPLRFGGPLQPPVPRVRNTLRGNPGCLSHPHSLIILTFRSGKEQWRGRGRKEAPSRILQLILQLRTAASYSNTPPEAAERNMRNKHDSHPRNVEITMMHRSPLLPRNRPSSGPISSFLGILICSVLSNHRSDR
ncbi:hypothetical protein B0H14DRAFT_2755874 [Mycena olivaceomarginata]|nr:hypothetical protein B0H14DRAFT_2755874 [Mycena olivaceomarginata]